MRIAESVVHRSQVHPRRARSVTKWIACSSLLVLQGCTVNAPSCGGRFEAINRPAPVSIGDEKDDTAAERDHTS